MMFRGAFAPKICYGLQSKIFNKEHAQISSNGPNYYLKYLFLISLHSQTQSKKIPEKTIS